MTQAERLEWFKTATEQEVADYFAERQLKQVVRDYAVAADSAAADRNADRKVRALFPFLQIAVAADNAEEEQAAQGSYSSAIHAGINENTSAYAKETKRVKDRWNSTRKSQSVKRDRYGRPVKQGQATDSVKRNALAARGYSMFASARQLLKATARVSN